MTRTNYATSAPWERVVGYSRAVQAGPFVHVSGTTATDGRGGIVGVGDVHAQTMQTLRNIEAALAMAGATLADVVRTRVYVIDIGQWEQVAAAHAAFFGTIMPASSMLEVSRLVAPELLVEIEADAYLGG